jgi:hypothetical protein
MRTRQGVRAYTLLSALIFTFYSARVLAQTNSDGVKAETQKSGVERDGQHDFDWAVGSWKIHLKRLLHPLTGSNQWVEFDGTVVCRKIWDGRAEVEEFNVNNPEKGIHIQGLALRLYNPQSHQWRIYWANAAKGSLDTPPMVGQFRGDRGEFYNQDVYEGRAILTRFVWTGFTGNSPHFEQSYSTDGGTNWETNWMTNQTADSERVPAQTNSDGARGQQPPTAERDGQHDFDPLVGSWKYHLKRRMHPLTGSTTWIDLYGTGGCSKVWDGRAELDTIEVDGSTGHIEGLTLRLYNPQTHQWSLYWANSKDGAIVAPQIGEFKDGRGEFYAQDTLNGKSIFVRFAWTGMTTNSPHFEQAFSDDGGKTWEVNWITDQTRVDDASGKNNSN